MTGPINAMLAMTFNQLLEQSIVCPYCGSDCSVLIDRSQQPDQQYVEDCQVCCQPMLLTVLVDSTGGVALSVQQENE